MSQDFREAAELLGAVEHFPFATEHGRFQLQEWGWCSPSPSPLQWECCAPGRALCSAYINGKCDEGSFC